MDADVKSLLFNIVGGVIVSLLSVAYIAARHKLRAFHLQRLLEFSSMPNTEVRMIYGQLMLPQIMDSAGQAITHPYVKPARRGPPPQHASYSMEYLMGSIRGSYLIDPARVLSFFGLFLASWATLMELGGAIPTWGHQALHELIHPILFQILFVPGVAMALTAVVM